jgi:type I restriction enzyme, S subunit
MKEKETTKPFYNSTIPSDWEVMPLSSLGKFSKGKGILKEQVIESGLPCIRYGEIYTTHDFIIKNFKSFISEDVALESNEIKNGDILFAGSGETIEEIGKAVAYIGNEKAYAGGDVIILSTNGNVNAECLSYVLETDIARRQKRRLGQGNSVVHIYPSDLATLKLPIPPLPEQKAIAHILSVIDTAINKNNLLISKKELEKKWLMQNLLTGKKRLKGFAEEWMAVKLGDLIKLASGDTKPISTEKDNSTEYPFPIYGGNGIMAYSNIFNSDEERIIIGRVGEYCGVTRKISGKCWITDNALFTTHITESISTEFLIYKLQFEDLSKLRSTGGQPLVSQKPIYNLSFSIPKSLKEQSAIAQVLQAANKEIQLLKIKTEKLRQQKKGVMQVLLTGKKRLKI